MTEVAVAVAAELTVAWEQPEGAPMTAVAVAVAAELTVAWEQPEGAPMTAVASAELTVAWEQPEGALMTAVAVAVAAELTVAWELVLEAAAATCALAPVPGKLLATSLARRRHLAGVTPWQQVFS
jgi:hypothetical protein